MTAEASLQDERLAELIEVCESQLAHVSSAYFGAILVALRELRAYRAKRETHVWVPREPTVAMLAAGALKAVEQPSVADVRLAREASREVLKGDVMSGMNRTASADEIAGILATMPQYYRAMLAASDGNPP